MADLEGYLRYLQRDDVSELVLQTGKVAALLLTNGKAHPLTQSSLAAGHIVGLLDSAGLRELLPNSDTSGEPKTIEIAGRPYVCRAARKANNLQFRFRPASGHTRPAGSPRAVEREPTPAVRDIPRPAPEGPAPAPRARPSPSRSSTPHGPTGARTSPSPSPSPAPATPPRQPTGGSRAGRFDGREPRCTWAKGSPESRMLAMLTEAREAGCSDVHLAAHQPARMRRLGQLSPVGEAIDPRDIDRMLTPLLERAGGDLGEQLAQRGYADFALAFSSCGRMRANFARGRTGLKGCFRMVADSPPTLEELGLPEELRKVGQFHQGLAVVSGPSGQGKTTTMAALVDLVNKTKPDHIITVEDPIEIIHPIAKSVISQRQVGLHTASFHRALKAALREDPDVIVIGELRDRETVEMALQAAETGHLVIASMSTPSGAKTIDRLIDMFPPDDQSQVRSTLAGALKVVVSQRLVPTADRTKMVAAAELITGNIPLWSLIRENKLFQLPSLLQRGRNYGMIRVEDSLNDLLARGVIDEDTAKFAADDPRMIGDRQASTPEPVAQPGGGGLGALRNMFGRKGEN